MSALTTRDALAKALVALLDSDAETPEQAADYLFASGAVIDVATLADDEAIHERLWGVLDDHGHNGIDCRPAKPMDMTVEAMLRDLAAALTERGAQ